jgi:hypothetical protein
MYWAQYLYRPTPGQPPLLSPWPLPSLSDTQVCCETPQNAHDRTSGILILCSILHRLGQIAHFDIDIVHQSRQLGHVVGLALPDFESSLLPDPVLVELRPLLVPEPPRLLVQPNVLVPASLIFVFAVCLVELFVHGLDLLFGVAEVLLEHSDVLQQAIAVRAPFFSWAVAAGVWIEGHV